MSWGHEMDQSLCRVCCSTLLCSGGKVLVLPAWNIFIKVAAFLFKAFCFLWWGKGGTSGCGNSAHRWLLHRGE